MKLTPQQMQALAQKVLKHWKESKQIHLKADEKQIVERILSVIRSEVQKEVDLEKEVNAMLDRLERTNPGEFERYKMYPMLKQKLAKDKKVIL